MKQTFFTLTLVLVIVGLLTAVVLGSRSKKTDSENPVFFYGNTCPHCADVEEWMSENKIEEQLTVIKKEVYDNSQNAQELSQAAAKCGLSTDNIGVPFLYAQGKCYVGSPDVIDYLSQKAGIK